MHLQTLHHCNLLYRTLLALLSAEATSFWTTYMATLTNYSPSSDTDEEIVAVELLPLGKGLVSSGSILTVSAAVVVSCQPTSDMCEHLEGDWPEPLWHILPALCSLKRVP